MTYELPVGDTNTRLWIKKACGHGYTNNLKIVVTIKRSQCLVVGHLQQRRKNQRIIPTNLVAPSFSAMLSRQLT